MVWVKKIIKPQWDSQKNEGSCEIELRTGGSFIVKFEKDGRDLFVPIKTTWKDDLGTQEDFMYVWSEIAGLLKSVIN